MALGLKSIHGEEIDWFPFINYQKLLEVK